MSPISLKPAIAAPLDPGFLPAVLYNRHYLQSARASGTAVPLVLGLERECGLVSRFETLVNPNADAETLRWSRSGAGCSVTLPALAADATRAGPLVCRPSEGTP